MKIIKFIFVWFALAVVVNAQCNYESPDGNYNASWYLDPVNSKNIHFQISARLNKYDDSMWTGIGFGKSMEAGDFITISHIHGKPVSITDRHGIGYREPARDLLQDVHNFTGRHENDVIQVEFARAVNTGDKEDLPVFGPDGCQDFVFPVGGGVANENSIKKHFNKPEMRNICKIDQCFSSTGSNDATTAHPAGVRNATPALPAAEPEPTAGAAESHKVEYFCQLLFVIFLIALIS